MASLDDVDADLLETEEAIQRIEDTRPPEKNPMVIFSPFLPFFLVNEFVASEGF